VGLKGRVEKDHFTNRTAPSTASDRVFFKSGFLPTTARIEDLRRRVARKSSNPARKNGSKSKPHAMIRPVSGPW